MRRKMSPPIWDEDYCKHNGWFRERGLVRDGYFDASGMVIAMTGVLSLP